MGTIHIHGGIPLQGQIKIQGSKNAALPIMAATVLIDGKCTLRGCPRIADVFHMQMLLESLGCSTRWEEEALRICPGKVCAGDLQGEAVKGMRSSLTLLGALIGKCKKAILEYPGGCVIGKRPIDMHIRALEQMNVHFHHYENRMYAWTEKLCGAEIYLECPSVGTTQNIVLAGVLAEGNTEIHGAAKEPEVASLCQFLIACGAKISGAGTEDIYIEGVEKLHGIEYEIPKDRIVAGTYLLACMATGGEVLLQETPTEQLESLFLTAGLMGASLQIGKTEVYVQAPERVRAIEEISTRGYPGFPTDLQSPLLSVLTKADGNSRITETIFENRFRVVPELNKLGADVKVINEKTVDVTGREVLYGAEVYARELRGGAALVVAGLSAQGETGIKEADYINRGYVNICRDLRELGARIYSV